MSLAVRLWIAVGLTIMLAFLLPNAAAADPVVLTWQPGAGSSPTGWKVYTKDGCVGEPIALTPTPLPASQHTYTVDVPLPTQDCWAVTAVGAGGEEVRSNIVAAFATEAVQARLTTVTPPTLAWDPYEPGPDATTGFKVYRQPRCTGTPTLLTKKPLAPTVQQFVDTRAVWPTTGIMCWVITAVQAEGREAPYTVVVTLPARPSTLHIVTDGEVQETVAPVP